MDNTTSGSGGPEIRQVGGREGDFGTARDRWMPSILHTSESLMAAHPEYMWITRTGIESIHCSRRAPEGYGRDRR